LSEKLPLELIESILLYLDVKSLCSFLLVSKKCYQLGSSPYLWRNTRLSKRTALKQGMLVLHTIPRFSQVTDVDLSTLWALPKDWNGIFIAIINSTQFNSVDISFGQNLVYVDVNLAAEALSSVCTVKMGKCGFRDEDLPTLLEKLLDNKITKELHIPKTDLSKIPVQIFIRLVDEMSYLDVRGSILSVEQLRYLMQAKEKDSASIAFRCEAGDISDTMHACEEVMVRQLIPGMFERIAKLDLKLVDFSAVSREMWINIFRCMSDDLTSLSIEGMGLDLVSVPGDVISKCFCKRRELRLSGLDLTADQWTNIFTKINESTTSLSLRMINLSDLKVETILVAFAKIKKLHLNYVCLNICQWNELFAKCFPRIKDLSVINVNLSEVKEECVVNTVRQAVHLSLSSTYLNEDQQVAILTAAQGNTTLKSLNLAGVNLSQVSSALLSSAVAGIVSVNLAATKLLSQQIVGVFSRVLGACKLRELDLSGVNTSTVPSKILALAVSRLRSVNFCNCLLTRDQMVSLSTQITENYSALEFLHLSKNLLPLNLLELRSLSNHVYIQHD